jgi:hypothetical protein
MKRRLADHELFRFFRAPIHKFSDRPEFQPSSTQYRHKTIREW